MRIDQGWHRFTGQNDVLAIKTGTDTRLQALCAEQVWSKGLHLSQKVESNIIEQESIVVLSLSPWRTTNCVACRIAIIASWHYFCTLMSEREREFRVLSMNTLRGMKEDGALHLGKVPLHMESCVSLLWAKHQDHDLVERFDRLDRAFQGELSWLGGPCTSILQFHAILLSTLTLK